MQRVTIEMTLDASVDIAYLYLGDRDAAVDRTIECDDDRLAGSVRLDLDRTGRLVGMEVESASRVLTPALLDARTGPS